MDSKELESVIENLQKELADAQSKLESMKEKKFSLGDISKVVLCKTHDGSLRLAFGTDVNCCAYGKFSNAAKSDYLELQASSLSTMLLNEYEIIKVLTVEDLEKLTDNTRPSLPEPLPEDPCTSDKLTKLMCLVHEELKAIRNNDLGNKTAQQREARIVHKLMEFVTYQGKPVMKSGDGQSVVRTFNMTNNAIFVSRITLGADGRRIGSTTQKLLSFEGIGDYSKTEWNQEVMKELGME